VDLPPRWEDKEENKREYGVQFFCQPDEHNDVASLFLSSTHHTIVQLFSMGRVDSVSAWVGSAGSARVH
jgi:chloride channel 7